ncbi:MAG TPA: hypothetical protein VN706_18350 [Gemmatimonadaceae bacterium]|nr:hypothetical protein [Gemmatimonadaceae bacterium]
MSLDARVSDWKAAIRGATDTTERLLGRKTMTQTPLEAGTANVLIVAAWHPPLVSTDSLVVAARALTPVREVLAYNGFIRRYTYDGTHVSGTVQHADSAPRRFDRVFTEPVFAFSEVDLLVRAVPFREGWSIVVPLFSESDEAVEYDTITVTARREDVWVVRFADPAIVSTYDVLARSREIVAIDTEQRRTRAVIRYRPESRPS